MSNPYGKNERKGPTLTLADLCGQSQAPAKPPCAYCDSGRTLMDDLPDGNHGSQVCPKCGRLLCNYA